jgi:hypothetical protein
MKIYHANPNERKLPGSKKLDRPKRGDKKGKWQDIEGDNTLYDDLDIALQDSGWTSETEAEYRRIWGDILNE